MSADPDTTLNHAGVPALGFRGFPDGAAAREAGGS
jgi:hypothetical protein